MVKKGFVIYRLRGFAQCCVFNKWSHQVITTEAVETFIGCFLCAKH